MLILVALCRGVLDFSTELVYGRILPGVAISFLIGNLYFAWEAMRLGLVAVTLPTRTYSPLRYSASSLRLRDAHLEMRCALLAA